MMALGCSGSGGGDSAGSGGASAGDGGPGGAVDLGPTPFPADTLVEVSLTLTEADWTALQADPTADVDFLAAVDWDGEPLTQVSLAVRGSGSALDIAAAGSARFNFRLDVNDTLEDQTLHGDKKLYLNHAYKDPTHLREVLAYEVLHALGVPAPRAALVHLRMNGGSLGIYTAVEAVDGEFLEERFPDPDGALYQLDAPAGTLVRSAELPPLYDGLEVERGEAIPPVPADFEALLAALATPGATNFDAVLDVDTTLRYLAANTALVNLDSYAGSGGNYFLYAQSGRFTLVPWDVGDAFGLATCGCAAEALVAFPIDAPTCGPVTERPLVASLLAVPSLLDRYRTHVGRAADALEALGARVEPMATLVRPLVAADEGAFFSPEDFEWALTQDLPRVDEPDKAPIFGLTRFMSARAASLRAQLAAPAGVAAGASGACP
jgi:spore coat protein CotH